MAQSSSLDVPPNPVTTHTASLVGTLDGPTFSSPPALPVGPPLPRSPLKRKRSPTPPSVSLLPRRLPHRACKRPFLALSPPHREYLVTPRLSMPGIVLGLSTSDIPGAGLGVFLRDNYVAGTRLATYGGRVLTPTELAVTNYDTTYVWSDINQEDLLHKRGLRPLILDANPKFSPLDWGGMINDGLTRPANVSLVRYRNQVYVTLLVDGTAGEELYLEYGGPYWQDRFPSLPQATQEEVLCAYGLTRCGQGCFTSSELFRLQQDGKAHRRAGHWFPGPPVTPDPPTPLRGTSSATLLPWLLGVPPQLTKPASFPSWLPAPHSQSPSVSTPSLQEASSTILAVGRDTCTPSPSITEISLSSPGVQVNPPADTPAPPPPLLPLALTPRVFELPS